MRFRLKSVAVLLLFCFANSCFAEAVSPGTNTEDNAISAGINGQNGSAVIEADRLTGKKTDQIEATGNATLRQGGQSISADRLLYEQRTQDLDAQGSVVLKQDGNTMSGPRLLFNLGSSAGQMQQPQFYLEENNARGSAEVMNIQDRQHFSLENATYTTCPAGNDDWMMKMGALELDRERQIGVARNASVEFKGITFLYTPWLNFPLNDQRKSGFLAPIFGGTSQGGTEITLPYYWNIAPDQDATFSPRLMMKRGLMLNNEYRYLGEAYGGELHVDVLPNDKVADRDRARFALKHDQALAKGLHGYTNLNRVSDDAYFRDLGDAVNATSQANLAQEGGLDFSSNSWHASARVQRFQTLQDPAAPIAVPYARLPQLNVNAQQDYSGARFAVDSEFVSFSHPTAVNGRRVVFNPSVSFPLVDAPAVYITPKAALHGTKYVMGAHNALAMQNASRVLPIYSVDSGIAFERESKMFGGGYVQTLEPRIFYVYVPYRDQDSLPNFDTAQADFSFTQMFTENRFFGNDRIGDASQVTLAMTSRLLEQENGKERLQVTMGERFSFKTPRVHLITPTTTINKSDILLAAAGRVTDAWSLDSEFQYDPNESHSQRYNIAARYHPEPGKAFNMGYRFKRNTLRQADVSTQWPLSSRWHAVGRWNYSLQDSRILEAIAGLEYNHSCWTVRLVAQRFATTTQQSNAGFFVQLELNDFVKVGADPLGLLKQSVPGYTKLSGESTDRTPQVLP